MSITLNFKGPGGKEFSVSVTEEMTVLELKEKCIEHVDIPVEAQRLIYKGKILKDKEKLSFYNVQDGHTLHLVKSGITPKEAETQKAAETEKPPTIETEQSTTSTGNNGRVELNQTPGDLSNPNFVDLMNNFSSAMNNNQNNDTRDMFANMLNNPLARSLMNEISNNPEMISNLLANTDILRGAMADNPYINQFLQNPNLLRETFSPEMVRATLNSLDNGNGMNYGNMDMGALSSRMEEMLARMEDSNVRGTMNPNPNATTAGNSSEGNPGNASSNPGTDNMNMSLNNLMQSSMFQSFLNNMRNNPNFGNMNFDGMNPNFGMNNPNVNTSDSRPLEEVYASQLKSLQEMGFIDVAANLQALQETGGDINATVTRLLERGFN